MLVWPAPCELYIRQLPDGDYAVDGWYWSNHDYRGWVEIHAVFGTLRDALEAMR